MSPSRIGLRRTWQSARLTARGVRFRLEPGFATSVPIVRSQIEFRPWCPGRTEQNPDAVCSKDRIKGCGELGVPVSEQQLDRGDAIGQIHQEVTGGLGRQAAWRQA